MNADRYSQMRPEASDRDAFLPTIEMGEILRNTWLKMLRNWRLLALFFILSFGGSAYYALTATPQYTANGSLLIDPREGQALDSRQSISAIGSLDALTVDSELRVLTSREVTYETITALDYAARLAQQESSGPSIKTRIFSAIGLEDGPITATGLTEGLQAARQREALRRNFVRGLEAKRAGDSYVIDVSYTSPDLVLSADAVNTLMQEYLRMSGQQQVKQVERTRDWLSERIADLEVSVRETETAVAEFRGENELVALQGELLPTEIALNAAVEELIRLRGDALVIEVQVQQLTEQIASGQIDGVQVPQEERSNALDEFQTRFAELLREEQELLISWAEDSKPVLAIRQQQEQIRSLILDEYRQVRDRLATQRDSLKRQVAATETVIDDLRSEYSDNIRQTVELRNLEREADAKRQLYERLLEEYNSSSQLLTFEGTSARVISWAVPPDKKSAPKSSQIVILSVMGALFLAASLAVLREALDRSFRTPDQVEGDLGVNYIGLIPSFQSEVRGGGWLQSLLGNTPKAAGPRWNRLSRAAQRLGFTTRWPTTITAETMRALHVQLKLQKEQSDDPDACQVVGFTSTTRGEGKTTTAFNFANFLAQQNERVAVIDLDLASSQMSRLLAPVLPGTNELAKVLENPQYAVSNVLPVAEFPNLAIIGNLNREARPISIVQDQERFRNMMTFFRKYFDVIVLDLPPVQGVADARLTNKLCDHLVYLVRWGWTPRTQVKSAFRQRTLIKDKVLGVLFSRAKTRKYRLFNRDDMIDYYG